MPDCDAIYLSPHLDDAALSCGGQIHRRRRSGERVLVVTLFAGDEPEAPPRLARELHRVYGLDSGVMAARRREDEAACEILGARGERRELLDAIYRTEPGGGPPLYDELERIFEPPSVADERDLLPRLERLLAELPPGREIFAPLAAGGHVDHRLVRRAAEAIGSDRVAFYEDYPYCARRGAVKRALAGSEGWTTEVAGFGRQDLAAKIAAVRAYASQVGPLFGSERGLERRLRRHFRKVGGERLWRPAAAPRV